MTKRKACKQGKSQEKSYKEVLWHSPVIPATQAETGGLQGEGQPGQLRP